MSSNVTRLRRSKGMAALGIFLFLGAGIASLAGTTLLWPGTALDRIWALNPRAYKELFPFGRAVGILFFLLAAILVVAGVGWFKRRMWGWRLAAAIIATQILGDLVSALMGRVAEGATGVVIAGSILLYLLRSETRAVFQNGNISNVC